MSGSSSSGATPFALLKQKAEALKAAKVGTSLPQNEAETPIEHGDSHHKRSRSAGNGSRTVSFRGSGQ